MHRFVAFNKREVRNLGMAMVSLSSTLVLLAATVKGNIQDIFLQLWDLRYGVLLASQVMSPSSSTESLAFLHLTLAGEGQALLTVSPALSQGAVRSTVHALPYDHILRPTLAAALGKSSASEEWLAPQRLDSEISPIDQDKAKLVSMIESAMSEKKPQKADEVFFKWIKENTVWR